MPPIDAQQLRMLERLRAAEGRPVPLEELRSAGVDFPAAVLSELELNGYPVQRVQEEGRFIGARLAEPERGGEPVARRRRWPWRRRPAA